MKNNFTQPFEQSNIALVSVFVKTQDDLFILVDADYDDCLPIRMELSNDETLILELAKQLYDLGLTINSLRKLTDEKTMEFSFVDSTPGTIQDTIVFYAQADTIEHVEPRQKLVHKSSAQIETYLETTSFASDLEKIAGYTLLDQLLLTDRQ